MRRLPAVALLHISVGLLLTLAGSAESQGGTVILPEADAIRATEEIRDARAAAGIIETLKAAEAAKDREIAELTAQIEALKAEAKAREIAQAIAEDREKRRQEDDARVTKALERAEQAIERSERALERAQARIEKLEGRLAWAPILGLVGLVVGLFGGAF